MLIRVVYQDGKFDLVSELALSFLIESRAIEKFQHSDGWVDIDSPHVRKAGRKGSYWGSERRCIRY